MDNTNTNFIISAIGIAVASLMVCFGIYILIKNMSAIKVVRVISGFCFFGYLILIIGALAATNPKDSSWDSPRLVVSFAFGFALIGATLSHFITEVGKPILGALFGWSIWAIFSFYIPAPVVNLVIFIVLSIAGTILITIYTEKFEPIVVSWIGATLFTFSIVLLFYFSFDISSMNRNTLNNAALILYILGTILTILVFGGSYYLHTYNNVHTPQENETSAVKA